MSRFLLRGLTAGVLAIALGAMQGAASAAPTCLMFDGLQHCPVGGATLAINQGELVVTGTGSSSGVSIATPGATAWHGESQVAMPDTVGATMQASSISHDLVTSQTDATRTANGSRLTAAFTASSGTPTFTVQVYRNGQLQGSMGKQPSGTSGVVLGWVLRWPTTVPDFDVVAGGQCVWTYRAVASTALDVTLPDGRKLVGDEIRFAEDVNPQGAYPYLTFDRLVFEGSMQRMRFLSESVQ